MRQRLSKKIWATRRGGAFVMRGRSHANRVRALECGALAVASLFVALAPLASAALAADAAAPTRVIPLSPTFDWAGWYFGGHMGYGRGSGIATVRDGDAVASFGASFGGQFGGVQLGYNYVMTSGFLLGFETDVTFPNFYPTDATVWSTLTPNNQLSETFDYAATARARLGYSFGAWMLYGTGGFAWSSSHFVRDPLDTNQEWTRPGVRTGWAAGTGVEYAFAPNWTARLEYMYERFGTAATTFPDGVHAASSPLEFFELRAGFNRKFGWPGVDGVGVSPTAFPIVESPIAWEIHGQSTYIHQGYPAFRALYSGEQSLAPFPQARETWTSSAFLTVRLWDGGELYYNPELLQGFGLSNTTGLAGFSNGEAQKSNFLYPHYNTSRLFIRQTFGLGGEQETVESDYGQMSGKRDISRVTFQVGKFAVHDVFDNNAYAQDSRVDFLNWSLWAAGAFDYAADKVGLTWGAVGELNQPLWALRAGYFLIGTEPNSNNFDQRVFKRGMYVAELETRYSLFSRAGKLRLDGWVYNANSGSFREAVDLVQIDPNLDINDAIVATRKGRIKYGYIVNLEQSITDDVGLFSRWSWNNGKTEMSAFTDISNSLSGGLAIKGRAWGRPNDVFGIAGVSNGLSQDFRDYVTLGGLGILIGDGALNYRRENIFETYYAVYIAKGTTFTVDYQYVPDPAYNADRGPVSIFSGRVHGAF